MLAVVGFFVHLIHLTRSFKNTRWVDYISFGWLLLVALTWFTFLKHSPSAPVLEECYEYLYFVTTATTDGVTTLYESGGMKVLGPQISTLPDGETILCTCYLLC